MADQHEGEPQQKEATQQANSNLFVQRRLRINIDDEEDCEFQIMNLNDEGMQEDAFAVSGVTNLLNNDEYIEQMKAKVEKRADLLAVSLQTVISIRKPLN